MRFFKFIAFALCITAQMHGMFGGSKWPVTVKAIEKTKNETPQRYQQQTKVADESQQKPTATPPKMWHSMVAGTAAGIAEVGLAGHALSYVINRSIQAEKLTPDRSKWGQKGYIDMHPRNVYRGIEASAGGMAFITALQLGLNTQGQKLYQQHVQRELTEYEKLVPAFCAGVAGAAVATPQEGLPNYQQNVQEQERRSINSWQAAQEMCKKYGRLGVWRGATATGIRDGGFTIGYKLLPSMIEKRMQGVSGENGLTHWMSKISAGIITAAATHPWHVIARHMQNNRQLKTTAHAAQDMYQKHGMKGFAKGMIPRTARVTPAIPVLSWTEGTVMNLLQNKEK